MKLLLVLLAISIGCAVLAYADDTVWTTEMIEEIFANANPDDINALTPELIAKNNYTVEVYNVTTEDGYVLGMHRIPASPTYPAADNKPVVFLMHGIFCSSENWIFMGPEKGFGYILADAGYDVWMGNGRGNKYSTTHNTTISEDEYWDFSWDEMGYYDLPAMIDFALETTGQDDVIYIGHSQGATSFYVMATQRPSYNDKIKAMFALAPVAYVGNAYNPLMRASANGTFLNATVAELFGVNYVVPSSIFLAEAKAKYCDDDDLSQFLCSHILFIIGGYDKAQLNVDMLPHIFGRYPTGGSIEELVHYTQEIQSNKFCKYDYSQDENLIKYGATSPLDYDLSLVTAPVHLLYSGNDWMCALEDMERLYSELGNPIQMRLVDSDDWTHFDYIWGIDVKELVYDPIIETLKSNYSSS